MVENVADETRRFSAGWMRWIQQLFSIVQAVQGYGSPANAGVPVFPVQIGDNVEITQLTPAGPVAAGTIIFPANPVNGQRIIIASTQPIAALTLNASFPINNPPAALSAGIAVSYYFSLANSAWYRLA